GSYKKRGKHMEQRKKLGIVPAFRGRSNTKQPPPEPSNALQKVEKKQVVLDSISDIQLLVALASSYRYKGKKVKEEIAKSEAKILGNAIKNGDKKKPIEDEEVVRILSTRSKLHLQLVFNYYEEIHGKDIAQDLGAYMRLAKTLQCLYSPQIYFSKTLDMTMISGADENTKEGLIHVIVTRADADMKAIKGE
ncbi:hypothetical protein GIB67_018186, partial [Kingdonia uniflora]